MKQPYVIGLIVVLLLLGGVWFFTRQTVKEVDKAPAETSKALSGFEHKILRTQDGWVPEEITIKKGDSVTWSAGIGRLFWPASNLHPTHRDYPEGLFDPKQPVEPDQSWSFTFDEVGDWKYHDHLAPYYTGIVHVTE